MSLWKIAAFITTGPIGLIGINVIEGIKNSNDNRKETLWMTNEAESIINKAKSRLKEQEKKANKIVKETNLAIENNYKLKSETLIFINSKAKATHDLFLKKKFIFEDFASRDSKPRALNRTSNNLTATAALHLPIFNNKKENASRYLEEARQYSIRVDEQISKIIKETVKLKLIHSKMIDEKNILKSILTDIKSIYPELDALVKNDKYNQVESQKALFLGMALETYIESINCNLISNDEEISSEYITNISKLKMISLKIKEIK